MAGNYKTPGVYIQEPDNFPPSSVGVETAVPAFIGYTEFAVDTDGRDLHMIPKQIGSMAEYEAAFGRGYASKYYLSADTLTPESTDRSWGKFSFDGTASYDLVEVGTASFNLRNSMRMFFANGGGACFVCSCGLYESPPTGAGESPTVNKPRHETLIDALEMVGAITGPTVLAIPDAVLLENSASHSAVAVAMLKQCQAAGDRMALLDVFGTEKIADGDFENAVAEFRAGLANAPSEALRYGAAYFPSLVTSIVSPNELDMTNFAMDDANRAVLVEALTAVIRQIYPTPSPNHGEDAVAIAPEGQSIINKYIAAIGTSVDSVATSAEGGPHQLTHRALTDALIATVPGFSKLLDAMAATQNVLPPSGAIAGVWTTNDVSRGVWNAPANTGVTALIRPSVHIDDAQQEDLNAPLDGLAVNAIRTFEGRGNLIWGARTLDGPSSDWRYIQVRRTMIYVEQSVKQALENMVFKPNTAETWITVTSMIESFLHGLWAAGGLMGSSAAEAYKVRCGLGSTMTPDDVLNGIMRVQITVQMVHPAEFMELTFKQQMLGSA